MKKLNHFKRTSALILSLLILFLTACDKNIDSLEDDTPTTSTVIQSNDTVSYYETIKVPFKNVLSPIKHDDKLIMAVATEDRTETDCCYLVSYDIKSSEYETIFESKHEYANIQHVQCNESWLVWNDVELYGSASVIYFMNLATKNITKVNEFNPEAPSCTIPKLMGDCIYWIEEEGVAEEKIYGSVYSYNCKTGKKEKIDKLNDIYLYNLSIAAGDGKVVWSEKIGSIWGVYIYDVNLGSIKRIDTGEDCCYSVSCSNGYVLFAETKDFYRGDASAKTRLINLSNDEISDANTMAIMPTIFDNYAFAFTATSVCFYKRDGNSFVYLDSIRDSAVSATLSENNIVITQVQNAGMGTPEGRVNETELHIFDFNNLSV